MKMNEHPIEGLMLTAMNSIRDMVDVNTIIGEPIETSNNIIIIPISKVGFGFAAGGSEFKTEAIDEYSRKDKDEQIQYKLPFGGGSGAGVSITPVAFLVIQENNVKLLPVSHSSTIDRLLDYVPDLLEKTNEILNKQLCKKEKEYNTEKIKEEKSGTVVVPNTNKFHPKRNKPMKYEFDYEDTPLEHKDENTNIKE